MANKNENAVFVGKGNVLPDNKSISVSVCLSKIPKDAIRKDDVTKEEWVTLTLRQLIEPRDRQTHSLRVFYPSVIGDDKKK